MEQDWLFIALDQGKKSSLADLDQLVHLGRDAMLPECIFWAARNDARQAECVGREGFYGAWQHDLTTRPRR
jgi:hypothetical protein